MILDIKSRGTKPGLSFSKLEIREDESLFLFTIVLSNLVWFVAFWFGLAFFHLISSEVFEVIAGRYWKALRHTFIQTDTHIYMGIERHLYIQTLIHTQIYTQIYTDRDKYSQTY